MDLICYPTLQAAAFIVNLWGMRFKSQWFENREIRFQAVSCTSSIRKIELLESQQEPK